MAVIRITDLALRTIIGLNEWERKVKQDIIINVEFEYNSKKAQRNDSAKHIVDYKAITKRIIALVEGSQFLLLEKLADMVLKIVMKSKMIKSAVVRIDKPQALRFAKSVSVEVKAKR